MLEYALLLIYIDSDIMTLLILFRAHFFYFLLTALSHAMSSLQFLENLFVKRRCRMLCHHYFLES